MEKIILYIKLITRFEFLNVWKYTISHMNMNKCLILVISSSDNMTKLEGNARPEDFSSSIPNRFESFLSRVPGIIILLLLLAIFSSLNDTY